MDAGPFRWTRYHQARIRLIACGLAASVAVAVVPSAGLATAVVPSAAVAASVAPSAPPTSLGGDLASVSAVSPSDAWAAGDGVGKNGGVGPLILHWAGAGWTRMAIPVKGATLYGVSADSARDAWAVGGVGVGSGTHFKNVNVALHWNGTSWAKVPVPSPGKGLILDQLTGVSALSPDDVWAIGAENGAVLGKGLVLHWNGTAWTQVPIPQPAQDSLQAVTALSSSDVWAVGEHFGPAPRYAPDVLILHWNGTSWARIATPRIKGHLTGVSALSPHSAWAVGTCCGGINEFRSTVVLHWNGTAWARQPSPSPSKKGLEHTNRLFGVSARSATDAWAIGLYGRTSQQLHPLYKPLVLHWNGTAWTQVTSPSFGPDSELDDVAASSPTDAWAVGGVFPAQGNPTTLILHWNGTAWTRA